MKVKLGFMIGTILLYAQVIPLSAQDENRISCTAFVRNDSIMLRWAPSSLPVWQSGIDHGYIIKRYTIAKAEQFIADGLSNGKLLTPAPVRPSAIERFETLATSNRGASVVQEAVFSPDFRQPAFDFTAFMNSYEELEVRLGFALFMCDMSHELANAAGLFFSDKGVVNGERYVYSISLADTPEAIQVDPAVIVVDAGELTVLPAVTDIQSIFLDRVVRFRWPVALLKGAYSAYILEKSPDGKNFKPVSDLPLVNFSQEENPDYFICNDSLDNNNDQVFYRVIGINPFGITGPSSGIIKGNGIAEFSAYATIDTAGLTDNSRIFLKWRISETGTSPVIAINILRSDSYDGPYEQVNRKPLNPRTRTFTDEKPSQSNYYQVMLTGKDDLKSYSFPWFVQTEDNEPPLPPRDLSGSVDSAGFVSMIWKSNSEPDFLGYKVFRANSPGEEFIALDRPIKPDNYCKDSINLNTLSQNICYQVVAIDRNYNASEYSQVLVLSRPDTIPPAPGIITRIDYSKGKLTLIPEESPSPDVAAYEMYLRHENDTSVVPAGSWEKLPEIIENEISLSGTIECSLVTIDNHGNRSVNSRKVFAYGDNARTFPLRATQAPDGSRITLTWEAPAGFTPLKTVIYRGEGDNPAGIYATIASPVHQFEDENTGINTSYNYRIILYNAFEAVSSGILLFTPETKIKR